MLPVDFVASSLLLKYLAPEAEGHVTEKVIEAEHTRFWKMNTATVPVKLLAAIVTMAARGSAGKERPCAQIGAGLSSFFPDILRLDNHDRKNWLFAA